MVSRKNFSFAFLKIVVNVWFLIFCIQHKHWWIAM